MKRKLWRYGAYILAALALCGALAFAMRGQAVYEYQKLVLAESPSAERAMHYGASHFDYAPSWMYDLAKAQYFYQQAEILDPAYPYLNHQLARIEFLRGHFKKAKAYIDKEIELHGDTSHASYYIRGLIEGYAKSYDAAAEDYAKYLSFNPNNWAAINDYAWVLIKAKRFREAYDATARGLKYFPTNPWLLNSNAIAAYELGDRAHALKSAQRAVDASDRLSAAQWAIAYPGNDPQIAQKGVVSLRESARTTLHMIETGAASSTVQ